MQLLWLTDIHLDFLNSNQRIQFYRRIKKFGDALIISGDIAEASCIASILEEMAKCIVKPLYFILGNHDYYRGQISEVRSAMNLLSQSNPFLFWLGSSEPVLLEKNSYLTGVDGWADGRHGNFFQSKALLNDSHLIAELLQARLLSKAQMLNKMQELADGDANHLYENLKRCAHKGARKILVITHVPPFKETARHQGKMSDDDHLPFFSSQATGNVLITFATEHPDIEVLVLCGHTHDNYEFQAMANLTIRVGGAEYSQPHPQGCIDVNSWVLQPIKIQEHENQLSS